MPRRTQLRIYTIAEGALDEFVEAWSHGVRPLRERHGFTVDGAWTIPEHDRFVWLLSFAGPGSFEEADGAYYASPDRAALSPDPARLIVESQTYWLSPIPE